MGLLLSWRRPDNGRRVYLPRRAKASSRYLATSSAKGWVAWPLSGPAKASGAGRGFVERVAVMLHTVPLTSLEKRPQEVLCVLGYSLSWSVLNPCPFGRLGRLRRYAAINADSGAGGRPHT